MKFESDTDIDRLLRRHARRKAASSTPATTTHETDDNDASAGGRHLDADEMNAYAEGAVPAALRMSYLAHLADCDACRTQVAKLALAANVTVEPDESAATTTVPPSRSWRDWLAALFAPPVLRYAVPALALLAVMVVAFVAMRDHRRADLVAQNDEVQTRPTTGPGNQSEQESHTTTTTANTAAAPGVDFSRSANSNAAVVDQRQAETPAADSPERKKEVATEQGTPAPQNEPKPAEQPDSGEIFGKQNGPRDETLSAAKSQPAPVTTVPATKAPREDDDRAVDEETAGKPAGSAEKNKTPPPPPATSSGIVAADKVESKGQAGGARPMQENGRRERPARGSRANDVQLSSEASGADAKDDGVTETRSVSGRQFRRRNGAWVDTAYSSSRTTVNVARGSEQYRALVADEPGIRTIADQLGGTVIIVWKNRAYRIY